MTTPYIELKNVTKYYLTKDDAILALDDVNIEIEEGQFIGIVGPSGCGKTTILKLIAGLIPYTAGEIRKGGELVKEPQTDLGIIFQDSVLMDWRNVLDNVLAQIEIRGLRKGEYRQAAMDLLEAVGLDGFEDKMPYELSGGMRQRVSICRSLVHDPPLLLMDEPFGALDALTREQISMDIQHLWMEKQKTAVLITHSIPEAVLLSDLVIVMTPRPGKVADIIKIDMPRPRRWDRLSQDFNEYSGKIRRIFQEAGVLSLE
ncbi:MAG: ABC transporter ATP-binding protein [Chloroflexi bacterium]|nr:MAG: ABC transporter ATP-binding protein [Chloroflexota bacterium]